MYDDSTVGKFIVFKIADYFLALPISNVVKVLNHSSVVNKGLRKIGLFQIGRHTIKLLDLHQHLNAQEHNSLAPQRASSNESIQNENLVSQTENESFLMIIRDQQWELCGIYVDELPDLMEIPYEIMRELPQKFNAQGKSILEIASHAAVISEENSTKTILILDVEQVTKTSMNETQAPALKAYS